jgi:hypothetical protein
MLSCVRRRRGREKVGGEARRWELWTSFKRDKEGD